MKLSAPSRQKRTNRAVVACELARRSFPLSVESLSRICGLTALEIEDALKALQTVDTIECLTIDKRRVYRSKQALLWGSAS